MTLVNCPWMPNVSVITASSEAGPDVGTCPLGDDAAGADGAERFSGASRAWDGEETAMPTTAAIGMAATRTALIFGRANPYYPYPVSVFADPCRYQFDEMAAIHVTSKRESLRRE